jgi:hypothetical protein
MATFKMATKNVLSQSGFDEPVIASNVDFSSATFPAGHVIQTVFDHDDTITNFGHDTSYVDIGGSDIAITPTSTSSKILYVMNVGCQMVNNNNGVWVQILRGSTSIRITKIGLGSGGEWVPAPLMIATIDSPTIPSTPVAITYKCQIKVQQSVTDDDNARTNPNISSGNKGMFIMAQEIAG